MREAFNRGEIGNQEGLQKSISFLQQANSVYALPSTEETVKWCLIICNNQGPIMDTHYRANRQPIGYTRGNHYTNINILIPRLVLGGPTPTDDNG